jgi:hypothetical protein
MKMKCHFSALHLWRSQPTVTGVRPTSERGTRAISPLTDPPGPYDQWDSSHFGMNNPPLVNWAMVSNGTWTSYRSGTYQQYDSSGAIDMTNGRLGGISPANDWTATDAGAVMTGVATWNANNSWKIRVAFAIGAYEGNQGPTVEAQAVHQTYVNSATCGTPANWYQINGLPLLVVYAGDASTWANYIGTGVTPIIFNWSMQMPRAPGHMGVAASRRHADRSCRVLVEQVSPGWIHYLWRGIQPMISTDRVADGNASA